MSAIDLRAPPDAVAVDRAIARFADLMKERYGKRLQGLLLFGSRARGDYAPFSDVDVAVVVDDLEAGSSEVSALTGIAYDVFLDTGAEIHPWAFSRSEWNGDATGSPGLLATVRRDARAIGTRPC